MDNPYQPPGADLGTPAGAGEEYEFAGWQEARIARAAKLSRIWGILALVMGGLMALMFLGGVGATLALAASMDDPAVVAILVMVVAVMTAPLAVVFLATGGHYIGTGRAFQEVVDTSGNDVGLLMTALERITKAFRIEMVVIVVLAVLTVLLQIVAAVFDAASNGSGV